MTGSDLPPSAVRTRVIVHAPFLPVEAVGQGHPPTPEDIELLQARLAQQASGWSAPSKNGRHSVEQLRGEPELQRYAPTLSSELGRYLPHRLAERWLQVSREELHSEEKRLKESTATSWTHLATVADIWGVGVGLLTSVYQVDASPDLSWSEFGLAIYESCRLIDELRREFVIETANDLMRVLAQSPELRRISRTRNFEQAAELLWKHVLILCELPDTAGPQQRGEVTGILVPDGDPCSLPLKAQAVELCVGTSASAASIARLLGVLNVIWAASLDFDRILFRELRAFGLGRHMGLEALEAKTLELMTLYERVQEFRSAVDHTTVHLTRLDEAIWRGVGERWGQQAQLDALDKKLQALQNVYRHLVTSLDTRRSRRLNDIVLAFTIAAAVTLGLSLADFFGEYLRKLFWVKATLVIVLMGAAVAVGLLIRRVLRRESFGDRVPGASEDAT
jgi:hypothetical protein